MFGCGDDVRKAAEVTTIWKGPSFCRAMSLTLTLTTLFPRSGVHVHILEGKTRHDGRGLFIWLYMVVTEL